MKALRFLVSAVMFVITFSSAVYAQFDDVYFDPKKDVLPESYAKADKYSGKTDYQRDEDYAVSGGYEGNKTINSGSNYDDNGYSYDDGYDDGYQDGYYTSRINRFHRYNNSGFGYYDPWFYNGFYDSWAFRPSVTFMYDPFFNYNRFYRNNFWWDPYGYNSWYGYPYGGYGYGFDPYFNSYYGYNGWYGGGWYGNGWYGNGWWDNNATKRVYGARNGGAVVGSNSGYRDRSEIRTTDPANSRTRQSTTPRTSIDERSTPSTRNRSDVKTPQSGTTTRERVSPERQQRQTPERTRTTPQRETRPARESSPRSYETPSRTRSERSSSESFSSPSRSSSPSGSSRSGGDSGSSGRSSSSGRTGRGG